jgi:hypothetical protein
MHFLGRPAHDARLGIFVQRLEGTPARARGIETVHALALHERGSRAIFRFVELDDVAGEIVQVVGRLMQPSPLVSGGVSLASAQADSQALQPMQMLAS